MKKYDEAMTATEEDESAITPEGNNSQQNNDTHTHRYISNLSPNVGDKFMKTTVFGKSRPIENKGFACTLTYTT